MIRVGKKWDAGAIYIGRGSPLGSPFNMHGDEAARDESCDRYEAYIEAQIKGGNPKILNELERLARAAESRDITLGCYCSPKRCHGDTIKRILEHKLKTNLWH